MGGPLLTVPLLAPRIELAHSWCMVRMCGWEIPTILSCLVFWFTVALTYRWDCHRQDMATSLDLSHSTSRFLRSCVLPPTESETVQDREKDRQRGDGQGVKVGEERVGWEDQGGLEDEGKPERGFPSSLGLRRIGNRVQFLTSLTLSKTRCPYL